jgi:hypothetical protein
VSPDTPSPAPLPELGYPAYRCPFCHEPGTWRLDRYGDAVASWSCELHLAWVMDSLQREGEVTRVTVYRSAHHREGAGR